MTSGAKTVLFVGIAAILVIVLISSQKPRQVVPGSTTASNVDAVFGFGTAIVGAAGKIFAPSQNPDDVDMSSAEAGHFGVDYS